MLRRQLDRDGVLDLCAAAADPSPDLLAALSGLGTFDLAVAIARACRANLRKVAFASSVEVYGPPERNEPFHKEQPLGNALEGFFERASRGDDLSVFGDGSARRDLLHVNDAARAIVAALRSATSGVFNIAHPQVLTLGGLARLAVETVGCGASAPL